MKRLACTVFPLALGAVHAMACGVDPEGEPATERFASQSLTLWSSQQQLTADSVGDDFGRVMSIDGDTAVVGAPLGDGRRGIAYVFSRNDGLWTETLALAPEQLASVSHFGTSVRLSGDTLVVGAPLDTRDGVAMGVVYVFVRDGDTWSEVQRLSPADGAAGDGFGTAVDFSGGTLVVGSPGHDALGEDAGASYVFRRDGAQWIEAQKLLSSAAVAESYFGFTVAAGDDVLFVAAPLDDVHGPDSGVVHVFAHVGDSWTERQTLRPVEDWRVGAAFGDALSLDGNHLLVGSPGEWSPNHAAGAAYTFEKSGGSWIPRYRIVGPSSAGDRFGTSVALDKNRALIGAMGNDTQGDYAGVA